MQTIAYLLILLSALIHATWNVLAKHAKGNTPALVFAQLLGSCFVFPFIFLTDDPWKSLGEDNILLYLSGSVLSHASYAVFLSTAYVYGDVGLVYPLARGIPILLTAIGLQVLHVEAALTPLDLAGIVIVILGIAFLCAEALIYTEEKPPSKSNEKDINDETFNPFSEGSRDNIEIKQRDCSKSIDIVPRISSDTTPDVPPVSERRKLLNSIALAVAVGFSSASYSTLDALAVQKVPPILYLFLAYSLSALILIPYLFKFHYEETIFALSTLKLTILCIAPCLAGAYLIILLVFSIFYVRVALVVAVRTSSVLLGSFIGVVFLKERYTSKKFFAIAVMTTGIILIKFG